VLPYPVPFYARVLFWGERVEEAETTHPSRTESDARGGAPARP
jgi:hypothetical protein